MTTTMFEGLRRLYRKITTAIEAPPDSVDERRPQRVDPDPPKNDWFSRTRARSLAAAARNETAALDRLDALSPTARLSKDDARIVDELLERATMTK